MIYGIECWTLKKKHIHEMSIAEMRMLRWISGNKRNTWFEMKKSLKECVDLSWWNEKKCRERLKITLMEVVKNDMSIKKVTDSLIEYDFK